MFDGFRPGSGSGYFVNREVPAVIAAVILVVGPVVYAFLVEPEEEIVTVELAPEIQDFAVEEEEEEEPEEEPPPPPPDAKVEIVKKVKPKPKPQPPKTMPLDAAPETEKEKAWEVEAGSGKAGGTGLGPLKKPAPPAKQGKQIEKAEPPKKPKPHKQPIDPTKPIDRPENATLPKPLADNAVPKHPEKLRDQGITGKVVIKLHIHRDGTVRGAKVLRKSSSATTDEEKKEAEQLFLAAVIKAVKTWKYKPATLAGTPISIWHTVTIPFTLTD